MANLIVIGIGNPLMTDEGVGIRLIEELAVRHAGQSGVEFADAGASGMQVVHRIAGHDAAILIDCAKMGEAPGVLRRFTPEEARSRKALTGLSLHEGDLLDFLDLSRRIGELPGTVVIFGIEPVVIDYGERLSPELEARMPEYLQVIEDEITSLIHKAG